MARQGESIAPRFWQYAGLLMLLIAAVYWPAWSSGGFIWDDNDYVTENQTLRALHGLWRIWSEPGATPQYYPLVHTTFWLEYRAWGLWSPGYHAINVLLHALNCILLLRVLRYLRVPGAWAVACVFAVHPVHAESVAWITERKNVLSTFFYLLSLLCFLRGVLGRSGDTNETSRRQACQWIAGSFACYLCALLSKTVTCTLPVALLIILWWREGRVTRRHVLLTLPYFAVGLAFAVLTVWMEHSHVGARGREWAYSLVDRLLIAGRALWFYPSKLVWPSPLMFFYPKWEIDTGAVAQWMVLASFVSLGVALLWLSRRIGRGPAACVLFYAATIAPALGFVNTYPMRYSFVADHFQYLASIGVICLVVVGAGAWLMRKGGSVACGVAAAAIVGVLSVLTWQRATVLSSEELLWRDTLAKNPTSEVAHNNLGNLLTEKGRVEEGLQHYMAVIARNPNDDSAHLNAGLILCRQGRMGDAVEQFREAVRVRPRDFEAMYELGRALEKLGRNDEALESWARAIEIKPTFVAALISRGMLLEQMGRRDQAKAELQKVLEIEPSNGLANGLLQQMANN